MVRKAKGKNSRKLELTAAGFPVRSAIAYGNPVKARPHSPATSTNASTPRGPVTKPTPRTKPRISTGTDSATTSAKSATISPSSSELRLTGVSSSRSK